MIYKHKKTGWTINIPEPTQSVLEAYFKEFRILDQEKGSLTERYGSVVRAATNSGWIEFDVDGSPPAVVSWIALKISEVYETVTTIPPE